jgi:hypothetical protein
VVEVVGEDRAEHVRVGVEQLHVRPAGVECGLPRRVLDVPRVGSDLASDLQQGGQLLVAIDPAPPDLEGLLHAEPRGFAGAGVGGLAVVALVDVRDGEVDGLAGRTFEGRPLTEQLLGGVVQADHRR